MNIGFVFESNAFNEALGDLYGAWKKQDEAAEEPRERLVAIGEYWLKKYGERGTETVACHPGPPPPKRRMPEELRKIFEKKLDNQIGDGILPSVGRKNEI